MKGNSFPSRPNLTWKKSNKTCSAWFGLGTEPVGSSPERQAVQKCSQGSEPCCPTPASHQCSVTALSSGCTSVEKWCKVGDSCPKCGWVQQHLYSQANTQESVSLTATDTDTCKRQWGRAHNRWGVTAEIAFLVHLLAFCLHTWTPSYYWLINSSALPAHIKHIKDNWWNTEP